MDVTLRKRDGRDVVALRSRLPHVADDAPKRWVEMAYEGTWRGHGAGEFQFTRALFDAFVARFNEQKNPAVARYEHPDPSMAPGQPMPAAGWVLDMEVRDSPRVALWGLVEFTPRAASMIRDGEYRYCSVEVAFASIDRVTGEEAGPCFLGLGLTNDPFLDGQQPITLSRAGASARTEHVRSLSMDPKKNYAALAKMFGLDAGAPVDKVKAVVDAFLAWFAASADDPVPAVEEMGEAEMSKLSANPKFVALTKRVQALKLSDADGESPIDVEKQAAAMMVADKMMTLTGLDAAALVAAIEANGDALTAVLTGAPAAGMSSDANAAAAAPMLTAVAAELSIVKKSNAALGTRLSVLEGENKRLVAERESAAKALLESEITALVDDAIKTGHAVEAMRVELSDYARVSGVEKARKLVLSNQAVPTGTLTKPPAQKPLPGQSAPSDSKPAANADDYTPRDDAERTLLSFAKGMRSNAQKARLLSVHRAKHVTA